MLDYLCHWLICIFKKEKQSLPEIMLEYLLLSVNVIFNESLDYYSYNFDKEVFTTFVLEFLLLLNSPFIVLLQEVTPDSQY